MTQPRREAGAPPTLVSRWLAPQDYSADTRYRSPARLYGKLSRWIGVPLTSLGFAPRHAVTLEVPGRRTRRLRRNPVLLTTFDGAEYLVSLAGESEWSRNVRAADGRAALRRRGTRPVLLVEVPPASRAPVLAAYQAGAARSGEAEPVSRRGSTSAWDRSPRWLTSRASPTGTRSFGSTTGHGRTDALAVRTGAGRARRHSRRDLARRPPAAMRRSTYATDRCSATLARSRSRADCWPAPASSSPGSPTRSTPRGGRSRRSRRGPCRRSSCGSRGTAAEGCPPTRG